MNSNIFDIDTTNDPNILIASLMSEIVRIDLRSYSKISFLDSCGETLLFLIEM